jgi:hypothetical protein
MPPRAAGTAPKPGRAETERRFLSAVLADFSGTRETVKKFPPSLWRRFRDRRHQVLWRALAALDLPASFEERLDRLIAEDGGKTGVEKLAEKAAAVPSLEEALLAAGALTAAGGRAYIRRVAGEYPVAAAVTVIAREAGFI